PGVGSAASAMTVLRERGLDEALRARVAAGKATLGICLGLQLALEETDEDGGVTGLGLLPGRAVRLRQGRVPRCGWAPGEPGGEELAFLDVQATLEGRPALLALVEHVAERLAVPFTVGGGVRSVTDAAALLRAGADKVSVNTAALERPALISELADVLGSQAV